MRVAKSVLLFSFISLNAYAEALVEKGLEPSDAFLYQLKESLVKVSTTTKSGGHGFGTGVAITKDHVVTNCHVLSNASGISVSKWGVEYPPVSLQADWKHDLCILKFEWAELKPVQLGDSASVRYEQPVISISMPSDSPAPYIELSTIKALYPFDDSEVIRSKAAFSIGASGSPLFDYAGKLVGISTFKSPGRRAYFYNMPIKWVKALLETQPIELDAPHDLPFWDAPNTARPFFMQIVLPFQNQRWQDVQIVATQWSLMEPNNAEVWYYLGEARRKLGDHANAQQYFKKGLLLHTIILQVCTHWPCWQKRKGIPSSLRGFDLS
ncbi:MAG: trypsin-like peptidase domain-containing protein [Methylophilaceae bacterium]